MSQKYSVHCAWSKEDAAYIACVPELPGCKADGATIEEAIKALQVVVSEWVATAKDLGRPVPEGLNVDGYEEMGKKFQHDLKEYIRKVVEKVMADMPALSGRPDPADCWKNC